MRSLFLASLVASLLLAALVDGSAVAAVLVPKSDDEVLEVLPTSLRAEEREIRALRSALAEQPEDVSRALDIAWRYVALGRRSGDPRYHGWAAGVARRWLEEPQPAAEVLMLRATLRQHRHEFRAALEDLSQLLARNPRDSRAWLARATLLQVQGEVQAAKASCVPLLHTAHPLTATACLARAGAASGNAARSFEALSNALAKAPEAEERLRRFALTSLAEIAVALGRESVAERSFREALALRDPDSYTIAAFADFLLDRGRAAEVQELIPRDTRSDGLLLRRVLAGIELGEALAEIQARALSARYAAARERGVAADLGLQARFALEITGDPVRALELAQQNFRKQREPRDVLILLESALAAGKRAEARPGLDFLRETGLEDQRLHRVAAALGDA